VTGRRVKRRNIILIAKTSEPLVVGSLHSILHRLISTLRNLIIGERRLWLLWRSNLFGSRGFWFYNRGRYNRDNRRNRCLGSYKGWQPVETSKIVSDGNIVIEHQRQDTDCDREQVAYQHTDDFKDSNCSGWLQRLRRVAHQFGGVDKLKDTQDSGEDGEWYADHPNNTEQSSQRESKTPKEVENTTGESHPGDNIHQDRFLLD
jgi:hypothetical protein